MKRNAYPYDLTDAEWKLIEPSTHSRKTKRGRKSKHGKREILNAIFYLLRTGCCWRHLPHDFPPWKTVYTQFRRWRESRFFERVNNALRDRLRILLKCNKTPSASIVDSQSIKTTEKGGLKGYDGVKKIKGCKRHILVDTQGFLIEEHVSAADLGDREGLQRLLEKIKSGYKKLKKIWGDMGYQGKKNKRDGGSI